MATSKCTASSCSTPTLSTLVPFVGPEVRTAPFVCVIPNAAVALRRVTRDIDWVETNFSGLKGLNVGGDLGGESWRSNPQYIDFRFSVADGADPDEKR